MNHSCQNNIVKYQSINRIKYKCICNKGTWKKDIDMISTTMRLCEEHFMYFPTAYLSRDATFNISGQ